MARRSADFSQPLGAITGQHTMHRLKMYGLFNMASDGLLTGADIWKRTVEAGFVVDPESGRVATFAEYRDIRRATGQTGRPHAAQYLKLAAEALSNGAITGKSVSALLGTVTSEETDQVRLAAGRCTYRNRLVSREGMDPKFLLTLFRPDLASRLAAALGAEHFPAIAQPSAVHARRVMELSHPWNILGAATLIRGAVDQMSYGTMSAYVGTVCDHALVLGGASTTQEAEATIDRHIAASSDDKVAPATRAQRALKLYNIINCAETFVCEHGASPGLIGDLFGAISLSNEYKIRLTDIELGRANDLEDERDDRTITRLVFEGALRNAVDNRFAQVMRLHDQFDVASQELRQSGADWLVFEVREPCVLLDGSLGAGEQFSRYRLCTARHACEIAMQLEGNRELIKYPISSVENRTAFRADEEFILLYEGSEPVDRASQCEDPFFVEMFRWAMCDAYRSLPSEVLTVCIEQCRAWGYTPIGQSIAGMLTVARDQHALANALRQHNSKGAPVLVPIARFAHAILIGRLAASFSDDTGPRASEILQVKPEGLSSREVAGRKVPYFLSRPKCQNKLVARDISPSSLRLIARLRRMVITRFGGDERDDRGRIAVPTRNFQGARHALCPPSRYLIQTAGAGMRVSDLNACLRVLFAGLCEVSVQEERFVFTTKADLANFGARVLRKKLAHRETSNQYQHYSAATTVRSSMATRKMLGAAKAMHRG